MFSILVIFPMSSKPKDPSVFYLTRFGKPYIPLILLSLGLLVAGRVLVSIQTDLVEESNRRHREREHLHGDPRIPWYLLSAEFGADPF